MNRNFNGISLCFFLLMVLHTGAGFSQGRPPETLSTQKDSASYALGALIGKSLKQNGVSSLNNRAFLSGLTAVLENRPLKIDTTLLNDIFGTYVAEKEKKQAKSLNLAGDLALFETPMALALKKNTDKAAISGMQSAELKELALALLHKSYNKQYRYAVYKPHLAPAVLGNELMIGDGYSRFEGITGIYLPKGRHLVLVDGIEGGKEIALLVPNWTRQAPDSTKPEKDPAGWGIKKQIFILKNGANLIELEGYDGLAYISYYSNVPEKDKPVRVHFVNGQVNGYFDTATHTDTDWNRLIDQAVYPIIDARGRYVQLAYPAAACRKYAYGRGVELLNNYDSLIHRQHRLMGLIKYRRVPENRILARVNYNYYMFRDDDGVSYMGTEPGNAMPLVVDPASVIKDDPCWGFSHEVGHVHQLRPYFNWGGLGEVSNNVFSLYGTKSFGNKSRISNQENYRKARESIIARKISYLQEEDVFNRLVPFWQLQLYFEGVGGYKDFYPDLFEAFRRQGAGEKASNQEGWNNRGKNPAVYQLNFVRKACETGRTDLTDFFEKYGFFHVGNFKIDDYGSYNYEMTQEMVDACKREIAAMKLPKPKVDLTTLED